MSLFLGQSFLSHSFASKNNRSLFRSNFCVFCAFFLPLQTLSRCDWLWKCSFRSTLSSCALGVWRNRLVSTSLASFPCHLLYVLLQVGHPQDDDLLFVFQTDLLVTCNTARYCWYVLFHWTVPIMSSSNDDDDIVSISYLFLAPLLYVLIYRCYHSFELK